MEGGSQIICEPSFFIGVHYYQVP